MAIKKSNQKNQKLHNTCSATKKSLLDKTLKQIIGKNNAVPKNLRTVKQFYHTESILSRAGSGKFKPGPIGDQAGAQGDSQSIGRVVRFGDGLELKSFLHHELDLLFVRLAIAAERVLDLKRGEFMERQLCLLADQ